MSKWEYTWDTIENYNSIVAHAELLLERGDDGWELVSVVLIEVGSSNRLRLYWKRQKQ